MVNQRGWADPSFRATISTQRLAIEDRGAQSTVGSAMVTQDSAAADGLLAGTLAENAGDVRHPRRAAHQQYSRQRRSACRSRRECAPAPTLRSHSHPYGYLRNQHRNGRISANCMRNGVSRSIGGPLNTPISQDTRRYYGGELDCPTARNHLDPNFCRTFASCASRSWKSRAAVLISAYIRSLLTPNIRKALSTAGLLWAST